MSTIKVFQVNDCDWYAGSSLEECLKAYEADTGLSRAEILDECEPHELTENEMEKLMHSGEEGEWAPPKSFRETLDIWIREGQKFPSVFASTEW